MERVQKVALKTLEGDSERLQQNLQFWFGLRALPGKTGPQSGGFHAPNRENLKRERRQKLPAGPIWPRSMRRAGTSASMCTMRNALAVTPKLPQVLRLS